MKQLKEKAEALVGSYRDMLSAGGITLTVSVRYYEERWQNQYRYPELFHLNRHHSLILTVRPLDKALLPKEYAREYAFLVRASQHLGKGNALYKIYGRNQDDVRVLRRVERRIVALLRRAQRQGALRASSDTWLDAWRYVSQAKYSYKNKILGKPSEDWLLLFLLLTILPILPILLLAILYLL